MGLMHQNRSRTDFKAYVEELAGLLKVEVADPDGLDLEATNQLFAAHVDSCQESVPPPQS